MATLIAVYNSEGLVGRCDSHCHSAVEPECTCICSGRNHGVGLERATENTREFFQAVALSAAADGYTLRRGEALDQDPLPLEVG